MVVVLLNDNGCENFLWQADCLVAAVKLWGFDMFCMLYEKLDVYMYDMYLTDVKGNWEIILFQATDAELVQN